MVFSSFPFLWLFLPFVLIGNCFFQKKGSNWFLLAASLLFYAWGEPKYVVILLFSITINYAAGILLSSQRGRWKKCTLSFFIFVNIFLLGFFKYFNFFVETINSLFGKTLLNTHTIPLPIGISFFTFQAISYLLDLYRGKNEVQRSWCKLALYISFFPQLIAGPIIKYHDIENQLNKRNLSWEAFFIGMKRFCFGLAKKVVLSNTISAFVNTIIGLPQSESSSILSWMAAIGYTMQIFFDFSGYSDMAIGLASMFGFSFPENFNSPYQSQSIRDFWRRWHISLSTWFRDYLYIPLGGNRKGETRTIINLFIVFFATGLWHGAAWNFVVWGLFHGFFIIIERLFLGKILQKVPCFFKRFYTMFVVIIGWTFFMSVDISSAGTLLSKMFSFSDPGIWNFWELISIRQFIIFLFSVLLSLGLFSPIQTHLSTYFTNSTAIQTLSGICAIICLLVSIILLASASHNPFIYFRF